MNNSTTPVYFAPKKSNKWLIILLSVLLAVSILISLFLFVVLIIVGSSSTSSLDTPTDDYIGVVHIEGTISASSTSSLLYSSDTVYSHAYVLSTIEALKNDAYNRGILLYVDTPGGEIYATDEVYSALLEYKEETNRPVYAYFATYACSGGYYLAMAADEICAHRMTTTGSIGVSYGTHIDLSGLCEKLGVKVEDITSGDNKAMGSYFSPLTDEQREIYESQLDEYYGYFVDVVAAGRGLPEEFVTYVADGRTYTAKQAKDIGLIDLISEYDDYAESVRNRFGSDVILHDFSYTVNYEDLLYSLGYTAGTGSEIEAVLAAIKPLSGVLAYYSGN